MSPEIRRAALLAAAKTTFIVSLGCSSNLPPPSPTPAVPCAQYLDGLVSVERQDLPVTDPLHDRPDVYGAFADIKARGSERTRQCCIEHMTGNSSSGAHRWACCSALPDPVAGDPPMACTPWGPPCPPELIV